MLAYVYSALYHTIFPNIYFQNHFYVKLPASQ